tara:strand:+ start:216 stop:602 length:387 start_codon:yes stop_codon:yes gene_type:complete
MENFEWKQINKRKHAIELISSAPSDLLRVTPPENVKGWNRVSIKSNVENQFLSGASITDSSGERYRFRKNRRGNFDQIFNFSSEEKQIEVTGLTLTSVQIVIYRSSPLRLLNRVVLSAILDVLRLGVR